MGTRGPVRGTHGPEGDSGNKNKPLIVARAQLLATVQLTMFIVEVRKDPLRKAMNVGLDRT